MAYSPQKIISWHELGIDYKPFHVVSRSGIIIIRVLIVTFKYKVNFVFVRIERRVLHDAQLALKEAIPFGNYVFGIER